MPQPQRPPLVFRIGVTGHRPNRLGTANEATLRSRVSQLLTITEDVLNAAATDVGFGYSGAFTLRVVSPLAEGADRLVVEEALRFQRPVEFDFVLPFAGDLYRLDFATDASKEQFDRLVACARRVLSLDGARDPSKPYGEPHAYEAAGNAVLQNCDLLVAIWDGEDSQLIGGTSQMVKTAALCDIPIAWIHSRGEHELVLVTTRAGEITGQEPIDGVRNRILEMVGPRVPDADRRSHPREQFFRESSVSEVPGDGFFDAIVRWASEPLTATPEPAETPPEMLATIEEQLLEDLGAPYAVSNELAIGYARRYRSAFAFLYSLAFLAISLAVASFWIDARELSTTFIPLRPELAGFVGLAELVTLAAISLLYWYARRCRWHERWMDYRAIAEQLRHHQFLLPTAQTSGVMTVPHRVGLADPALTWTDWYVRAVVRQIGVLAADVNHRSYVPALWSVLAHGVTEQIAYHITRQHLYECVDQTLERIAQMCFLFAALSTIAHFWVPAAGAPLVLAVLLPAAGALIHGFLSQGDFTMLSQRSARIQRQLELVRRDLNDDNKRTEDRPVRRLATIATLTAAFATTMLAELSDWRGSAKARPVLLP